MLHDSSNSHQSVKSERADQDFVAGFVTPQMSAVENVEKQMWAEH